MALDFSKIDISAPESLQTVQTESKRAIENDLTDEASKFYHAIKAALPTVPDQDLARSYQTIIQDLGWLVLPVLPEAQRFALLRGSFRRALEIGVYLDDAFTRLVYSIPALIWLEIAPQYLQALRENTEPLGPKTLGAWFSDFQRSMPDQKPTDLDVLRYLGQDPAAKELPEVERTLLIKAFQYYIGLTPLSLAEVDKYVTPEERAAFTGEEQQEPKLLEVQPPTVSPPAVSGDSATHIAPVSTEPREQSLPTLPVLPPSRPVFPPLPRSPHLSESPESDSLLDRTPIARPRHDEHRVESGIRDKTESFGAVRQSVSDGGRNQELGDGNESVVNLRQQPLSAMPQTQSAAPRAPQTQPTPPAPSQPRASNPSRSSAVVSQMRPAPQTSHPASMSLPGSQAPASPRPTSTPSQPRPAPQYAPPQPVAETPPRSPVAPSEPRPVPRPTPAPQPLRQPSPQPRPAALPPVPASAPPQNQNIRPAPPPNLPIAKSKHNEGQEVAPYKPEQDPFMPHKPKPVPKLAGNVVNLKREERP